MKNKYRDKSDSEINTAVHMISGGSGAAPDYCNDPAYAWPIIERNRLNVYPSEGPENMPWVSAKNAVHITDHRPLRAAMILYVVLAEKEQLK